MKVITLNPEDLASSCKKLENQFKEFDPDCIIGIANAGWIVCQQIFPHLPHYQIKCQRSTTSKKENNHLLKRFIIYFPEWLKNILRNIEAKLLSKKDNTREIYSNIDWKEIKGNKILVIDDAVDSGNTLLNVVEKINKELPGRKVESGVITVTTSNPRINPTASVYKNILIRFPWSIDYKPKR